MGLQIDIAKFIEEKTPEATLKSVYGNERTRNPTVTIVDGSVLYKRACYSLSASVERRHTPLQRENDKPVNDLTIFPLVDRLKQDILRISAYSRTVVVLFDKKGLRAKQRTAAKRKRASDSRGVVKYDNRIQIDTQTGGLIVPEVEEGQDPIPVRLDFGRLACTHRMVPSVVECLINNVYPEEMFPRHEIIFDYRTVSNQFMVLQIQDGIKTGMPEYITDKVEADVMMLDWMERYRGEDVCLHSIDGDWIVLALAQLDRWVTRDLEYGHIIWDSRPNSWHGMSRAGAAEGGDDDGKKKPRRKIAFVNVALRELLEHGISPSCLMSAAIVAGSDFYEAHWFTFGVGATFRLKGMIWAFNQMYEAKERALSFERYLAAMTQTAQIKLNSGKNGSNGTVALAPEAHRLPHLFDTWCEYTNNMIYWCTGHWPKTQPSYHAYRLAQAMCIA